MLSRPHQTFPLHGYPSDHFRFSKEALALLFEDAGLETLSVGYRHRVEIMPPSDFVAPHLAKQWNRVCPSDLLVALLGRKPD